MIKCQTQPKLSIRAAALTRRCYRCLAFDLSVSFSRASGSLWSACCPSRGRSRRSSCRQAPVTEAAVCTATVIARARPSVRARQAAASWPSALPAALASSSTAQHRINTNENETKTDLEGDVEQNVVDTLEGACYDEGQAEQERVWSGVLQVARDQRRQRKTCVRLNE